MKALIVRLPDRSDVDLGDLLAIARSEGKRLFGTKHDVRVIDVISRRYGWIVIVQRGCSQHPGCKGEEKNE